MLSKIVLAAATLAVLGTPSLAATPSHGQWTVLQDAGGGACYVADRRAGPDEGQLSGSFTTERQALSALAGIAACQSVNIDPDKDSAQSNS